MQPTLARLQEKGQVTLPAAARRRLGLKKGDLVSIIDTPEGLLLTPQVLLERRALDRIGEVLSAGGVSLEDLIDTGRDIRSDLIAQEYGLAGEPAE
jgi:AbrB family looped-hinge helix DNA binding protein